MAILFDFYEGPPQEGDKEGINVYARPVFSHTIDLEMIAAIIHERSSLTVGDVYSTLISLGKVLSESLCDGKRVYLDGIGHFSVTLRCKDIKTKKDMRANNVSVKSIDFRADKYLKSDLMQARVRRSPLRSHSARLTNEEVDRRVVKYLEENQVMTRKNFQGICQMKQGLAFKHIHRLLAEGKMRNAGTKANPIYMLFKAGELS